MTNFLDCLSWLLSTGAAFGIGWLMGTVKGEESARAEAERLERGSGR